MNKFYIERCSLWRFKMEMVLAFVNLLDIANHGEVTPLSS
jgi:hypothetical protein